MRVWLISATLFFAGATGYAQPDSLWSRIYGGSGSEECYAVQQTQDGGCMLAGNTTSFGAGQTDFWLVKTNPAGDSLWSHTYGGTQHDYCNSAEQTSDGGYILAGSTFSFGAGNADFWLVKTDAQGDSLWARSYGTMALEYGFSVHQTADGGYILLGSFSIPDANEQAIKMVKTDADGDTIWTRLFGHTYSYETHYDARGVLQTMDGGYVLVGHRESYVSPNGPLFMKVSTAGDSLWAHVYPGGMLDEGRAILPLDDGGFLLGGSTEMTSNHRANMLVIRTDANGSLLWQRSYGGLQDDWCYTLARGAHDDYLAAGSTMFGGSSDFWLLGIGSNGDSLWSRRFGTRGYEACFSVAHAREGGFLLGGTLRPPNGEQYDMWVVRTTEESATSPLFVLPASCVLYPCYPNPFNSSITTGYSLAAPGRVSLRVFDLLGREVSVLKEGFMPAGNHQVLFNGSALSSGSYFVRLDAGKTSITQKILLLK